METKIVRLQDGVEPYPGAIGTPLLYQEGGGEAFFKPASEAAARHGLPGVWFLRDERNGHVSPTGEYVRVRVVRA